MTTKVDGTNGIIFTDLSTQNTGGYTGFRNRIINGAMMIDQRNAGASVTPTSSAYTVDRWKFITSPGSKFSFQQSSTVPSGFTTSLISTSLSAYSSSAGDVFRLTQFIEGYNVADLGFGTANASTVTISFWVRSSLTGTFPVSLINENADRSYVATYTISAANTWEQKSVTIAGDTTGTWPKTNGAGLGVIFDLGSGTSSNTTAGAWQVGNYSRTSACISVVGTNSATFYITGVQLEKGSVATPFENRLYGTELALCQRYLPAFFSTFDIAPGMVLSGSTSALVTFPFPVTVRAAATGVSITGTLSCRLITGASTSATGSTFDNSTITSGSLVMGGMSGLVAGNSTIAGGSSVKVLFTGCEL